MTEPCVRVVHGPAAHDGEGRRELGEPIAIVVGDCVGHDLEAATIMGQLRSACRAVLLQGASPAQTLLALDRFAALIPGAMCSPARLYADDVALVLYRQPAAPRS